MTQKKKTDDRETYQAPRFTVRPQPDQASLVYRSGSAGGNGAKEVDREPQVLGVYVISVAARLLDMHPQTLRKYERLGLIRPTRTIGMLRLYSNEDIQQIRLIRYLEANLGLNLAGVEWALTLLQQLMDMKKRLSTLEEAESLAQRLQQEIDQLFQALNLPPGQFQ